MNTVNQTAWANFRQNKGKNALTGIAIVLTALLLFVIPTIGFGQIDAQKAAVNELYPTYHGMYRDVDEKTAALLKNRAEIEALGLRQNTARVPVKEGAILMIYADETAQKLSKTQLESGVLPQRGNEIALSQEILDALGIQAKIGDSIEIPFQAERSGSLDYEQKEEFVITGMLSTSDDQKDMKTYFAMISREFMEAKQPEESRRYRAIFRIAGAYSMTSDAIEETFESMAEELGISQGNVVANGDYLWANYVDPAFYTGVAVVLLVVVLAGIMTICSIYYISTIYKVQEYGKIKALGATRRQVRQMVFREGMLVAGVAIPIGLALGVVFSKAGIQYLCASMEENVLAKAVAQVLRENKVLILKPWIFALTIAVTLLTVAASLVRPMQIASKISPVEAMRYNGDIKLRRKKRKGHRKMSLTALTGANLSRNKKRTLLTVVTLSLMGILFMVISTILSCADSREIARDAMLDDLLISVESSSGDKMHPEREWSVLCKNNPLNENLEKEIQGIPGVKKITKSSELEVKLKDLMDGDAMWETGIIGIPEEYAAWVEDNRIEGEVTFEELRQGDKIIMNKDMLHWVPQWKTGDTLHMVLETGDGPVEKSFEIAAIVKMPEGMAHYNSFLLPKETVDRLGGYSMDYYWYVDTEKNQTKDVEDRLRTMLEDQEHLKLKTYEEEVAYNEKNSGFAAQICYVFMAVLGCIGIMNLVNTLMNSIYVRRRELGILQAIGLSERQMVRMLQLEGLFYTGGTLALSLGVGSLAGYGVFLYAREDGMLGIIRYHYPIGQAVFLAAAVIVIQLLITYLIMRVFRRQSMIERIRFSE